MNTQPQCQNATTVKAINFNGGAIIDAQGREIPITEAMVQQALRVAAIQERPHPQVVSSLKHSA